MGTQSTIAIATLVLPVLSVVLGCKVEDGVGDPCTPEEEYSVNFPGFGIDEVGIETQSLQCATRLCLVNHFQGRVSCPGGQTQADLARGGSDPARCRIPGSSDARQAVVEPVAAWDLDRTPERAVYCSCRCDGPDRGARYCECPSGYSCTELIPDVGFGASQVPGSYCVRDGTAFDQREQGGPTCATAPTDPACEQ
jgi:hypothetical protein